MRLQPSVAARTPNVDVPSLTGPEALDDSWFDWKKVQVRYSDSTPQRVVVPQVVKPPAVSIGDPIADRWFR